MCAHIEIIFKYLKKYVDSLKLQEYFPKFYQVYLSIKNQVNLMIFSKLENHQIFDFSCKRTGFSVKVNNKN